MPPDAIGWRRALNPAIYLISILPGLAVPSLAGGGAPLRLAGLIAATAGVVLLQHAINLFNDVSDWRLGADEHKLDSWVRAFAGDTARVQRHALISFLAGGLLGLGVLIAGHQLEILAVAAPLIVLGYLYNAGPRPLSYTWMGEWVTGICYAGVFGCLWRVAGQPFDMAGTAGLVAFGLLAVALLLSHQPPQIESDRAAGKHSFAVRFGTQRTHLAARLLFALALIAVGTALAAARRPLPLQAVHAVGAVIVLAYLLRTTPNPRRLLLGGSAVIVSTLLADLVFRGL